MALFGSEKARKNEASNLYAQKYPLSNNVGSLQSSINLANIELVGLKNSQPSTSGGKRIKTRNITALSNRIMQLQNAIKDLQSGMSGAGALAIASPSLAQLPKVTSDLLLRKNDYNLPMPLLKPLPQLTTSNLLVGTKYQGGTSSIADSEVLPTSAEPEQVAIGDYAPPQGVQEGENNTKIMLVYFGVAIAIAGVAFLIYKNKK